MTLGVVVSDGVLNDVAERLLQQREVPFEDDRLLGDGELERDSPPRGDRSMAFDDTLDQAIEIDPVTVREVGMSLEACSGVQIVE